MKRSILYSFLVFLSAALYPQTFTGYEAHINAASSFLRLDETASALRWLVRIPASHRNWEWELLRSQTDMSSNTLKLDDAIPTRLALNNDGSLLAFGDSKGKIRIVDGKSLVLKKLIFAHSSSVYSVKFSHDGKYLASCSRDTTISILETGTFSEVRRIKTDGRGLADIDFSPDGSTILHCSWYLREGVKGMISLYDTKTGELKWRTEHNTHPLVRARFSPDGRSFGIGSWEWNVAVWQMDDLTAPPRVFDFNDVRSYSAVDDFCFSPDARYIAAATKNNTPRIWEVATGKLITELKAHRKSVLAIEWSSDGRFIFTAGDEGTIIVWDADSGEKINKLRGHLDKVASITISGDGSKLFTASSDSSIKKWHPGELLLFTESKARNPNIYAFATDRKYSTLFTNGPDSSLTAWDIKKGTPLFTFPALDGLVNSVAVSPDGSKLAACNWSQTVKVFDARNGNFLFSPGPMDGGSPKIEFSPDGKFLAAVSTGKTLWIWNGTNGELIKKITLTARPASLAFSTDSRLVATGDAAGSIEIFQLSDMTKLTSIPASIYPIQSLCFLNENKAIVGAGDDRIARIWDIASQTMTMEFTGHSQRIFTVALSSSGKRLVTGSSDQTVKIWDITTGEVLLTLSDFSNPVYNVIVFPDHKGMLVNSSGKEILFYPSEP